MLTKGKKLGAALLLSASTIFSGCAAKADDGRDVALTDQFSASECQAHSESAMSPPEVLELSKTCDAVIYYGEDIPLLAVDLQVQVLRERSGYNVIAVRGFPDPSSVSAVVNEVPIIITSRDGLTRGEVGSAITREIASRENVVAATL